MKKTSPTSIALTMEDKKIIAYLRKRMKPNHGLLSMTSIFRLAIRRMKESVK